MWMNIGDRFFTHSLILLLRNLGKKTRPSKVNLWKNPWPRGKSWWFTWDYAHSIGICLDHWKLLSRKTLISKANPKGFCPWSCPPCESHKTGGGKPIILTPKGDVWLKDMAYVFRYFWTLKEATSNKQLESPNLDQWTPKTFKLI